jgi:hypothetical protein
MAKPQWTAITKAQAQTLSIMIITKDTHSKAQWTVPNFTMLFAPCMSFKLLSTVGPTLCTYLYSQTIFRHVTVVATTISREHNTTDQKTPLLEGVYLVMHNAIFWVPLQHTSHVCWNIAWLYAHMHSVGPTCRQELYHVRYDTIQSLPQCSVCIRSTASSLEHQL